jgi:hypothetical protein
VALNKVTQKVLLDQNTIQYTPMQLTTEIIWKAEFHKNKRKSGQLLLQSNLNFQELIISLR